MGAEVSGLAVVDAGARLEDGVLIGPLSVVGSGVVLGRGTKLLSHAVVLGPSELGESNVVHPFAVIGGDAQSKRENPARGGLLIGAGNVFREHATVHRGTDGRSTVIGSFNLFMAGSHVAHDVRVGSHVTIANGVQIAGHVTIADHVTFGGLAGVGQYVRVGEGAFVAAGAMCEVDIPPFVVVQGDRARVRALNVVGLERRGVRPESIRALGAVFRRLYSRARGVSFGEARRRVALLEEARDPFAAKLLAFFTERESRS